MTRGTLARVLLMCVVLALAAGLAREHVRPQILIRQADLSRSAQEYSQAIDLYQQLVVLRPLWPMPHVCLGQIYLTQGKLEEAEEDFAIAWELDAGESLALAGLAEIAYHRGDAQRAIDLWRHAIALDPKGSEPRYRLGQTYLELSEFDLARQELRQVLGDAQYHQEANYYLGLLAAGDEDADAVEYLRLAVEGEDREISKRAREMLVLLDDLAASEDDAHVAAHLGRAYLRLDAPSLALTHLKRVVALQPDNHTARAYMGYALLALDDLDAARDVLRELTQLAPKHPLGHYFLGLLHRSEGYLPTALWEFKKSLETDPSNAAVYAEIADTYQRMGQHVSAGEWYRAATEVEPDEAGFLILLAQYYVDVLPRAEEGLAAARQAAVAAPDNAVAQDLLGWAFYLAGKQAQAVGPLEQAIALDPDFARAYYHLGVVYAQLGQEADAKQAYQRAIDIDTSGEYRQRAMAGLGSTE
ncbi:MAG: tetratricopeptide repeat protein [Anaerolineae bacterium]|nr:tetratricopeptide repeat protein [Anaerolineae bacterium]NIN94306.1 tetratricopeptide repeat protein [Anaerolineae bacterium]NIQ77369.1 tetratricopeptide repeat protein [Anaerolineae bacterium]